MPSFPTIVRAFAALCLLLLTAGSLRAQTGPDRRMADSLVRMADSMKHLLFVPGTDTPGTHPPDTAGRAAAPPQEEPWTFSGTVIDGGNGEGIPFPEIFLGADKVATGDGKGRYSFALLNLPNDTMTVDATGFLPYQLRINRGKGQRQLLDFLLDREATDLAEFVFRGGEDPAEALVKKIIARKPANNPDRLANYRYEVYNKLELDLEHLSRKQFEKLPLPMLKQFSFIYNITDSTSEETPILPFYLTESLSDYYYQRDPKETREFIKAVQVKGVKNESIDQYLGGMHQTLNSYDNFIPIFDKRFVSPVADAGLFYYKYKIVDTQEAYGMPVYQVQFRPRRAGENCFHGDFWVADSFWALQRISMEIPKDANINWVKRVNLYQEYAPVGDTAWFAVKEKFVADFVAPYGVSFPGFIGRKTTSYRKIFPNDDSTARVINDPANKQFVQVLPGAREHSDEFWAGSRHDSLSRNERAIYSMIDSIETLPMFTRFKSFMRFVGAGTVRLGPVDIGPYWNLYSRNTVEGARFRIGVATNEYLFRDIRLSGYLAYGFGDQRFKYRLAGQWLFARQPRQYIYASYTSDVDRSTAYYDQASVDNIFSVAVRKKGVPWKLAFVKEARFEYYKEYFNGFSHMLTLLHKEFDPYDPLPYVGIFHDNAQQPSASVVNSEVGLRLRYAYKEKFVEGKFLRTSLGSKYPILDLRLAAGLKGVLNSGYSYQRATFSVSDHISVAPLGWLYVNVFAGKYFGTLPYPLLEVHPGNELYYYNHYAFNMMNRFEFISDKYAGINLEHTIGGGVFNYIPLLKRAKLRQFWTAKGVIGSLSPANRALNLDKGYPFRTLEGNPYIELGTGVENILQIFRIDFVWRVTPQPLPTESRSRYFGIFGSVKFNF